MNRKTALVVKKAKSAHGTHFVGIRAYKNAQGEVTNQTVLVGYSYEAAQAADLETLKAADVAALAEKLEVSKEEAQIAVDSLIESIVNPSEKRSKAQKDAYQYVAAGVKYHPEKDEYYVTGLGVKKVILEKGVYPEKGKARALKDSVKYALDLRMGKIKNFRLKKAEIAIRGIVV